MLESLNGLKENTVVILHACCHNPTGYDLTQEQWAQVVDVCVKNKLIPFLDIAYQGFGDGLEEDAGSVNLPTPESPSSFPALSPSPSRFTANVSVL